MGIENGSKRKREAGPLIGHVELFAAVRDGVTTVSHVDYMVVYMYPQLAGEYPFFLTTHWKGRERHKLFIFKGVVRKFRVLKVGCWQFELLFIFMGLVGIFRNCRLVVDNLNFVHFNGNIWEIFRN